MKQQVTFGLVHGAWHGAWCWKFVQAELKAVGYESIAIDLPIDDPCATFDNYANVVVEKLKGQKNIVLVGHSRAGNVLPRVANKMALNRLIYICASFEPTTISGPSDKNTIVPQKYSPYFEKAIIEKDGGLTELDTSMVQDLFYQDCPPDISKWAVAKLRPQRKSGGDSIITSWPNAKQDYIFCIDDKIINPKWSRYVASKWLGVVPVEFPGGHSPFLSHPKKLAQILIKLSKV